MKRLIVLLSFALVMLCPGVAHASEWDSFLGGLNDFVNPEPVQEEVRIENNVRNDESGSDEESSFDLTDISGVVDAWTTVRIDSTNLNINPANSNGGWHFLRWLFTGTSWFGLAVGIVFFWWGLRKAVKLIFAAFRKGKISA